MENKAGLAILGIGGCAGLIYLLTRGKAGAAPPPPPECTVEGENRCFGNDLYQCIGGEWVLIEANSPDCYEPPPPPEDGYIDGRIFASEPDGVHIIANDMSSAMFWETWSDIDGRYLLDNLPVPADGSLYLNIIYNKEGYTSRSLTTTLNKLHPHRTKNVTLTPTGNGPPPPPPPPPPPECERDSDCPEGYECINGVCVPVSGPPPDDPMNGTVEGTVTGVSVDNVQIIIQKMVEPDQYNIGDTRCSFHHLYEYLGNGQWILVEAYSPLCIEGDPSNWVTYTDMDGNFMVSGLPVTSNWEQLKYQAHYTVWVSKEGYQCSGQAPNQTPFKLSISQPSASVSLKCK